MVRQLHVRLDEMLHAALIKFTIENNISLQDLVSSAIMQFLAKQQIQKGHSAFTFIDLFAGTLHK